MHGSTPIIQNYVKISILTQCSTPPEIICNLSTVSGVIQKMHQLCLVLKILASLLLFLSTNAFTSPIISRSVYHSAPPTKKFYTLSRLLSKKSPANSPAIDGSGDKTKKKLKIAVIGGGWAGYSLCESISTNNLPTKRGSRGDIEIIMVDASKQAKGGLAGGYRDETKNNRPVEAGIHGFWREYRNTFNIMESIEGVDVDEVLGSFSPSVLYSKNGKVAVAPVLLDEDQQGSDSGFCVNKYGKMPVIKDVSEKSIRRYIAALLPPPLDLPLLAEIDNDTNGKKGDSKLSPIDLLSGLGLVGAWADFEQESRVSWERYDSQPASLLFEKAGITDALYEEMVSPLLHVLPMCPGKLFFFMDIILIITSSCQIVVHNFGKMVTYFSVRLLCSSSVVLLSRFCIAVEGSIRCSLVSRKHQ